jgi:hypothetical protein
VEINTFFFDRLWLYHLNHDSNLIFSGYFLEAGSDYFSRLFWTATLLFYASHNSWDDRLMPPCPVSSVEKGLVNFLPRIAANTILLIQPAN